MITRMTTFLAFALLLGSVMGCRYYRHAYRDPVTGRVYYRHTYAAPGASVTLNTTHVCTGHPYCTICRRTYTATHYCAGYPSCIYCYGGWHTCSYCSHDPHCGYCHGHFRIYYRPRTFGGHHHVRRAPVRPPTQYVQTRKPAPRIDDAGVPRGGGVLSEKPPKRSTGAVKYPPRGQPKSQPPLRNYNLPKKEKKKKKK
ncbi:MAG: hypothetical protein ACYTHM_20180 [Planctomycetota bacterium]